MIYAVGIKALSNSFPEFNLSKENLVRYYSATNVFNLDRRNKSSIASASLKQFDNILLKAVLLLLEAMEELKAVVNELYSSLLTSFLPAACDMVIRWVTKFFLFLLGPLAFFKPPKSPWPP